MVENQGPNDSPPGQEPPAAPPPRPAGSSGLEPNIAGALSYLFGWITGLIFLVIEKESPFVRFHAVQSIGLGVAWVIVWVFLSIVGAVLPGIIGWLVAFLGWAVVGFGGFLLWLFMMYKAYQGEMVQLPIIGEIAKKESDKLVK